LRRWPTGMVSGGISLNRHKRPQHFSGRTEFGLG
jgi:hypothetical protein